MIFSNFKDFNTDGINTTETFKEWLKKDNGVIKLLTDLETNSVDLDINLLNKSISVTDGSITNSMLATNSVGASNIIDESVTDVKFAASTITTANIASGAVTSAKIADSAVTNTQLISGVATSTTIADGAVTASKLNLSFTSAFITDGSVTSDKMAASCVISSHIASSAVTSIKIADGTLSNDKFSSGSITNSKILDNSFTSDRLADNVLTWNGGPVISDNTLSISKLDSGQSGDAPAIPIRAWIIFNGVTGNNIRSGGIDSVTRITTGRYDINFSENFPFSNYLICGSAMLNTTSAAVDVPLFFSATTSSTKTISTCDVYTYTRAGVAVDPIEVCVIFL